MEEGLRCSVPATPGTASIASTMWSSRWSLELCWLALGERVPGRSLTDSDALALSSAFSLLELGQVEHSLSMAWELVRRAECHRLSC